MHSVNNRSFQPAIRSLLSIFLVEYSIQLVLHFHISTNCTVHTLHISNHYHDFKNVRDMTKRPLPPRSHMTHISFSQWGHNRWSWSQPTPVYDRNRMHACVPLRCADNCQIPYSTHPTEGTRFCFYWLYDVLSQCPGCIRLVQNQLTCNLICTNTNTASSFTSNVVHATIEGIQFLYLCSTFDLNCVYNYACFCYVKNQYFQDCETSLGAFVVFSFSFVDSAKQSVNNESCVLWTRITTQNSLREKKNDKIEHPITANEEHFT